MTDDYGVTIGEVYRLLLAMKEDHGQQLANIYVETRKTNGNVIRHEQRLDGIDREVRDLKRKPPATTTAGAALTAADDSGPGITKRDLKVIAVILVAMEVLLRLGPSVVRAIQSLEAGR